MHTISVAALTALFAVPSVLAQEAARQEVSVQETGFFTKNSSGNGISQTSTASSGLLIGYRYHFNKLISAEVNYGFTRDSQVYSGIAPAIAFGRIQSNVNTATADLVVALPNFGRFHPYVLGGGGALVFSPTGNINASMPGQSTQAAGAFLYGAGTDFALTHHIALRAEYRGYVYKAPSFSVASFNTDTWTHTAQPSIGFVYRF
jgi:outer membrane immunogenic protein